MPSVSLQLPILFDISAAGVVFGEDVSGVDIFDAHLKFTLDTTAGGAAAAIKTAFSDILYADASENDVSGVLFYYNSTSTPDAGNLAKVIQSAILNGKLKQHQGTGGVYGSGNELTGSAGTATSDGTATTTGYEGTDWTKRYQSPGIPLPVYSVTDPSSAQGVVTGQAYYTDALCDAGGTNFGRVLIRLMATSLMGHPFAQGFIKNESQIMEDISNCDISTQLGNNLFKGSYMFIYFLVSGQVLLFLFRKKKQVLTLSSIFVFANILISNFDSIRYQTKFDKKGNTYVHDLLTGKKWKKR